MNFRMTQPIFRMLPLALSLLLLSACGGGEQAGNPNAGPQNYQVLTIATQKIDLYTEYPAVLKGKEDIEIRAKIDGYIDAVLVDEGQAVKKGQVLFRISNPNYEQALRNAQAAVDVAEAAVAGSKLQVEKTQPLVNKEIVGDYGLKSAQIDLKSKEAALAQAKANLANARVNVGYLTITSPFDGVVGTLPHKLGSYVSSATSEPLTVVSNISTIYAYFPLNEKQQLAFFRESDGASLQEKIDKMPPVELRLADGSIYDQSGKVETISGQASSSTGSFSVRVAFPNKTGMLRSGNSGKVRMLTSLSAAVLVPQTATFELQGKRFIYLVDKAGEIHAQPIEIREVPGGQLFVVDSGLKSGDVVVIEGVTTLREGTKIIPKQANPSEVLKPTLDA